MINFNSKIPFFLEKFKIPEIKENYIQREALIDEITSYLNSKVIFINSPAGFGKTVLLSQLALTSRLKNNSIWFSVDSNDNFLDSFFYNLLYSFHSIFKFSDFNNDFDIDYNINLLSKKLNQNENELFVIIDNYHNISDNLIQTKIVSFINSLNSKIHFIFSGRGEIPNTCLELIYSFNCIELDSKSLLFTNDEIASFFIKNNIVLPDGEIKLIKNKTEGWALSLKTILINLLENYSIEIKNHYILDFILEELLNKLEKPLLDFLMKTALLGTFTKVLSNEVLEINNASEFIEEIEKQQLFISNFDKIEKTYKYNNLFSEILLNKLKIENKNEYFNLCYKIAKIFKEMGAYSESINYAVLTEDHNFMANNLSDLIPTLIINNEFQNLNYLVKNISKNSILANTKLANYYALLLGANYELDYAEEILKKIKNHDENNLETKTINSLAYLIIYLRRNQKINKIEPSINLIIKKIRLLEPNILPLIYFYLIYISCAIYDFKKTIMLIDDFITYSEKSENVFWIIMSKELKLFIFILQGKTSKVEETLKSMLIYLNNNDLLKHSYSISVFNSFMRLYAQKNDVILFEKYQSKVLSLIDKELNVNKKFSFYYSLCACNLLLNRFDDVLLILQNMEGLRLSLDFKHNNLFSDCIEDFKVYMNIFNNELEKIPDDWEINTKKYIYGVFSERFVTTLVIEKLHEKVLLLVNLYIKKGGFIESISILKKMLTLIDTEDFFLDKKIELYILKAIIYKKQNNIDGGMKTLKKALIIAEESSYISFFTRSGSDVKAILIHICKDLKKRKINIFNTFAYEVLEHFNKSIDYISRKNSLEKNLNPLSKKEIEILKLMEANLESKEILLKLDISINTLKTHSKNIYKKLSVGNKNEAFRKAKHLGFI